MRNPQFPLAQIVSALLAATFLACAKAPSDSPAAGGSPIVDIIGVDYAFQMPDTLPAGRTYFRFANKGKQDHEFNIVLLKTTTTLKQFIDTANADKTVRNLIDGSVGVLFAKPGKAGTSTLSVDLLAGRTYAIQCIFRDKENAPAHRQLGMFKSLTVKNETKVAGTPIVVDTIFGMDYAFKMPPTFTPGMHHVTFVNNGKQRHEIDIALLKPGVTTKRIMEVGNTGADVDSLIDESHGVLWAYDGTRTLGALDINFLPGREYTVVCTFMDTPKSPPHFALGMFSSIQVSAKSP